MEDLCGLAQSQIRTAPAAGHQFRVQGGQLGRDGGAVLGQRGDHEGGAGIDDQGRLPLPAPGEDVGDLEPGPFEAVGGEVGVEVGVQDGAGDGGAGQDDAPQDGAKMLRSIFAMFGGGED